jgi:hypothetical protein
MVSEQVALLGQGRLTPSQHSQLSDAVNSYLKVMSAFTRVQSAVKVSEPRIDLATAQRTQTIMLDAIQLSASELAADAPAPTDEQLLAQLEKFGGIEPGTVTTDNPYGYGYRLPNRIKLQYLIIPSAEVKRVVLAGKSDFEWNRMAYRYYIEHPTEFTITDDDAAINGGEVGPIFPSTAPAATEPGTRPFEAASADIREKLVTPLAAQLSQTIADRLQRTLNEDYDAARKQATDGNITGELTQYEYLQQVARKVGEEFGITIGVHAPAELLSETQLFSLSGISSSLTLSDGKPFSMYAMENAAPFASEEVKNTNAELDLYRPSVALGERAGGNIYYFRIVAAEASRAPRADELPALRGQVEADLRLQVGFEKAQTLAAEILEKARATSIEQAAADTQRTVQQIGPVRYEGSTIPGYPLSIASTESMIKSAFGLLTAASAEQPHPVTEIKLPQEHRILIAGLKKVESLGISEQFNLSAKTMGLVQAHAEASQSLYSDWFDADNIKHRTGYSPIIPETAPQQQR